MTNPIVLRPDGTLGAPVVNSEAFGSCGSEEPLGLPVVNFGRKPSAAPEAVENDAPMSQVERGKFLRGVEALMRGQPIPQESQEPLGLPVMNFGKRESRGAPRAATVLQPLTLTDAQRRAFEERGLLAPPNEAPLAVGVTNTNDAGAVEPLGLPVMNFGKNAAPTLVTNPDGFRPRRPFGASTEEPEPEGATDRA